MKSLIPGIIDTALRYKYLVKSNSPLRKITDKKPYKCKICVSENLVYVLLFTCKMISPLRKNNIVK